VAVRVGLDGARLDNPLHHDGPDHEVLPTPRTVA
jgi:hypothetical protein